MSFMKAGWWVFAVLLAVAGWGAAPVRAADAVDGVRLYAIDCGQIRFKDFGWFADTGEYDGKPMTLADPCFLIRHPKGILLWDTGLGDALAATPAHEDANGITLRVEHTLASQLRALGLAPDDVSYVAFSHFHFDHTGNADAFPHATWILNRAELAWATSQPTPFGVNPATLSAYKTAKTQMIDGDYDVFGDGSVRILKAPGHTPGSQVLMLRLKRSGTVILSGDLFHTRANRQFGRVPTINSDRADTLASINRIEAIARRTKARFVIQHDLQDFEALPKFPAYLD